MESKMLETLREVLESYTYENSSKIIERRFSDRFIENVIKDVKERLESK